jgi:hypothetical protein
MRSFEPYGLNSPYMLSWCKFHRKEPRTADRSCDTRWAFEDGLFCGAFAMMLLLSPCLFITGMWLAG